MEESPGLGRPKIEIDFEELNKLCKLQCTLAEIASFFDVSEDTIERRVKEKFNITFADYFDKKRKLGFISLRRRQFQAAEDGSIPMLIWLGKQWLEQSEKQEINHNANARNFILAYSNEEPESKEAKMEEIKE